MTPGRLRLASHFDARKILPRRDHQVGKRLVVLQILVVLGLDVLDQPRFHQQRVDFAFAFDVINVAISLNPSRRPLVLGCGLQEIAAGPAAQILGLADVDHATGSVLHQIDAGRLRKRLDLGGRVIETERLRTSKTIVALVVLVTGFALFIH